MREIDLPTYFERVGITHVPAVDLEGLEVLQRAHLLSIPFENLDIPLGRGISLDPGRVFGKLVEERRGGYCFEHNLLFLNVLQALGFDARPLIGRVWVSAQGVPPRTHRLSLVNIGGRQWIADVGFGGSLQPVMPLEEGHAAATPDGVTHRLRTDSDHGWMVERDGGSGFVAQYSFTLEAGWPADFASGNHYTSTAPDSLFTNMRFVSLPNTGGFVSLTDRRLRISPAESRDIEDAEDCREVLDRYFGIELTLEEVGQLGLFDDDTPGMRGGR